MQTEKLRATERLVRTLAHEVRNPLNNINLSIEQLESEYTQEGTKIYIDIINRNSKRIGDLITELLDSSRPTDIILEKISLQTVIDNAVAAAIDRINLKKIKLERHYSNGTVYVMADMEKLKIALLNIIINAVEAMEENEGP
jgi:signal transduction histidine kinase